MSGEANSPDLDGLPLVSVIIPTRNSARTIEACLSSVRHQTYSRLELIVIDNGSSDGTFGTAQLYADVVETFGPERSAQRNRGAHIARGRYFLFIDSDMRLEPAVAGECVGLMERTHAPAVVIPERSVGDGFWTRCRQLERSCYIGDDLVEVPRFFDRERFLSIGGFDEEMTGVEDWDLRQRLKVRQKLPHTTAQILHDEGNLKLAAVFRKKRYYGPGYRRYWHKYKLPSLPSANIVARPAFFRNWRRLLSHPVLASGLFFLKIFELVAAVVGAVRGPTTGEYSAERTAP